MNRSFSSSFLVFAVLFLCAFLCNVKAYDLDIVRSDPYTIDTEDFFNGTCGDSLFWYFEEGLLLINGTGEMENYVESADQPWYQHRNDIHTIILEEGVTSIGNYAFFECNVENISFPESLSSLGDFAFGSCSKLPNVIIPVNVETIGEYAFSYCSLLTSIEVAAGNSHYASIDGVLFDHDYITVVQFPQRKGKTVNSYTVPSSVKTIGDGAFSGSDYISSIILPDNLTLIGNYAFYECFKLTDLVIPDKVKTIGNYAFSRCSILSDLVIPDGVKTIGNYAFSKIYVMETIDIPASVESIGIAPFQGCDILTAIKVANGNVHYASKDGVLFDHEYKNLIQYPLGNETSDFTVPSTVESIGDDAFSESYLTTVTIPNGVLSVGNYCFDSSSYLSSIHLPATLTSIGDSAFHKCIGLLSVTIPGSVHSFGELAFCECKKLSSVIISNGVESIGESAFSSCTSLSTVSLPDGLKSIRPYAFSDCSSLSSIVIPDSVTSIGDYAFSSCSILSSITIPVNVISIGKSVFHDCRSLASVDVADGNLEYVSDGGVVFNRQHTTLVLFPGGGGSSYVVPNGVQTIGSGAFDSCENLVNVTIPSSVVSIESYAFYGCSQLTNVNIPDGITFIDDYVFGGCHKLESIVIPGSVTSIGMGAFEDSGLKYVAIPHSVSVIGPRAFLSSSIDNVTIPDSIETIGDFAFAGCNSMKTLFIPDSIRSFGMGVFSYSVFLETVLYQGTVNFPSSDAFASCQHLGAICASPDYKYQKFCDRYVLPPESYTQTCKEFRGNFSHCFKATYVDGEFIQQIRRNATLFESRTNGCVECHCYNESGPVSWSLCNSTDELALMCVDDKCSDEPFNESSWSVVIGFDKVKPSELNATEVVQNITNLTGISQDDLSVAIEIDETGYILRVVVYVSDETTAKTIASAVKAIEKGEDCEYGALCRTKSARVVAPLWTVLSVAQQPKVTFSIVLAIVAIFHFVSA